MNKDKQDAARLKLALNELVNSINELIDRSDGVSGLHLNGDVAPWPSLHGSGRFRAWLCALDDASELLEELNSQGDVS